MLMLCLSLVDTPEEKNTFEKLYRKYKGLMYFCAKKILQDEGLAEEAVQEAFLKLLKYLKKINDVECHKTRHLIVIIVESTSKDIYRREKKNYHVSWEEFEDTYMFPSKKEISSLTEVEKAILELPYTYREIFRMKYVWGYSNKEIADILNIRESTLRQRLVRGKVILGEILEEMEVYISGKDTGR